MTLDAGYSVNDNSVCDHCEAVGPVHIWLPAKYKADNWSPSSFSGDELIHACESCTARYGYNHERVDTPKAQPQPRAAANPNTRPFRWM